MLLSWNSEKDLAKCIPQTLTTADGKRAEIRWNDGKVDSSGRLWAGWLKI